MKIVWTVSFILMAWYQYWAYSTFWPSSQKVSELDGVRHLVEGVAQIKCYARHRRGNLISGVRIYGEFHVLLKNGEYFRFGGIGRIESCEEFYSDFFYDKHYVKWLPPLADEGQAITQVGPDIYEEIKLDGYFMDRKAYQVSFDDHEWLSYRSVKKEQKIGLIIMLSLAPLLIQVSLWFGSKTRKSLIEKEEWVQKRRKRRQKQ